jgi:hypothetical protein
VLDGFGGIVRLDEIGERFERSGRPARHGRRHRAVLVRVSPGRAHIFEVDGAEQPLVARPIFDRETVKAFAAEVVRLAGQWPPVEPDTARRTLPELLPHFEGDPLALGVRICEDVELAETGHLFIGPVDPKQSIGFVIDQTREPHGARRPGAARAARVRPHTPYPDPTTCWLHPARPRLPGAGLVVLPGRAGSILATPPLAADELPSTLGAERSPELVVRDMLKRPPRSRASACSSRRPSGTPRSGRSVAICALGGSGSPSRTPSSGARADIKSLERAERFVAARGADRGRRGDAVQPLEEHGRPGNVIVLGDTALFGLCEALDLPRRLYDETLSGSRGFWILVVPGVIHNRQPRFNEGPAMWHLEGATLPL